MIEVIKASGQKEPFDEHKVRRSLRRAGAKPEVINQIMSRLIGQLYDGISTKEIYHQVFDWFNELQTGHGYRYVLKQALMQLGPSGYPFEDFVARLLNKQGYKTQVGVEIEGQCVRHEVDIVAEKEAKKYLIECKFHNRPGSKTAVKEALYVQARFEDLKDFEKPWLITNTKLTSEAIKYGECVGMKLLAWRYPKNRSLEKLIEEARLHPITCLKFLSSQEKQILIAHEVVLCQEINKIKPGMLENWGIKKENVNKIKKAVLNLKLAN